MGYSGTNGLGGGGGGAHHHHHHHGGHHGGGGGGWRGGWGRGYYTDPSYPYGDRYPGYPLVVETTPSFDPTDCAIAAFGALYQDELARTIGPNWQLVFNEAATVALNSNNPCSVFAAVLRRAGRSPRAAAGFGGGEEGMHSIFGRVSGPVDPARSVRAVEPMRLPVGSRPVDLPINERLPRTITPTPGGGATLAIGSATRTLPITTPDPRRWAIAGFGGSPDGLGVYGRGCRR